MIIGVNFGHGFAGANRYYTQDEKLGRMEQGNLPPGDSKMHARYMQMVAMESEQAKNPMLTISISWDPGDGVNDQQMFKVGHDLIDHLGLSEHQYMIYSHIDQEHPHIHIMANTVHPDTEIAKYLSKKKSLSKQLDEFARPRELENGWRFVAGRHTPQKLLDRAGVEPYKEQNIKVRIEKTGANKVLFNADSWEQMHIQLAQRGFGIAKLPNDGGHIYRLDNPNDRIKPSAISQQVSLGKIEKRLGEKYQQFDEAKKEHYRISNNLGRAFADRETAITRANKILRSKEFEGLRRQLVNNPDHFGDLINKQAYKDIINQLDHHINPQEYEVERKITALKADRDRLRDPRDIDQLISDRQVLLRRINLVLEDMEVDIAVLDDRLEQVYQSPGQARNRILGVMYKKDLKYVQEQLPVHPEEFGEIKPKANGGKGLKHSQLHQLYEATDHELPALEDKVEQLDSLPHEDDITNEIADLQAEKQQYDELSWKIAELKSKQRAGKELTTNEQIAKKAKEYCQAMQEVDKLDPMEWSKRDELRDVAWEAKGFIKEKAKQLYSQEKEEEEGLEAEQAIQKVKGHFRNMGRIMGLSNPVRKVLNDIGKEIARGLDQGHAR